MEKTITVCDFCEEKMVLANTNGHQLCERCYKIYFIAKGKATEDLQKTIKFSIIQAENMIYLVQNDRDPISRWGVNGMKVRDEFLLALNDLKKNA